MGVLLVRSSTSRLQPHARSALLRLATRLIVEEALEVEVEDALGRGYYEHGAAAGAGTATATGPAA
jgi:hypothetical protein